MKDVETPSDPTPGVDHAVNGVATLNGSVANGSTYEVLFAEF
jgi:hypothetical protein